VSKLDHIENREVELAAVNAAKKQGIKEKYQNRINAYKRVFDSPDADTVMADLYEQFNGSALKANNGIVDTSASIAALGAREVLLYIERMMRTKDVLD
jgi:hypothetical protein